MVNLSTRKMRDGETVPDVVGSVTAYLDALGKQGWEAVGEVHVSMPSTVRPHEGSTFAQLLMKRPVQ